MANPYDWSFATSLVGTILLAGLICCGPSREFRIRAASQSPYRQRFQRALISSVDVVSNFRPINAWPPSTEEALRDAARDGHLDETHTVELKRELSPGDSANKELAADLASIAVDGGLLFIGIDEAKGPGLSPVPLKGLAERVESVARTRIDEPLHLTFSSIASDKDPTTGYLVIRVPASPRAPHMVGHRYWGRGDKTKYQLSDAEVERLMTLRERWAANTEQVLRDWMTKDPIPAESHVNGHLFVVASPVPQRERMLLPVFSDDWTSVLRRLASETEHRAGYFVPDIPEYLSHFSTTADGWAWQSYAVFGEGREVGERSSVDREDTALFLEVCEDGPLRLWCGRATLKMENRLFVFDPAILGLTARMLSLASGVSKAAGFLGSWDFGVGITGLQNSHLHVRNAFLSSGGPPYTAAIYSATTRAAVTEIEAGTGPILERLLGRLMRAIGGDQLPGIKAQFAPRSLGSSTP